jgi:hypothetical protein
MNFSLFEVALLLIPGYLAACISDSITDDKNTLKTDFDKTATGILLSVPVLLLNWSLIWLSSFYPGADSAPTSLTDFIDKLDDFTFLFNYALGAVFSAYIVAFLMSWDTKKGGPFLWLINKVRILLGRQPFNGSASCWNECFNGDKIVTIVTPTHEITGFVEGQTSSAEPQQELVLYGFDVANEYKDFLTKVDKVYYNSNTGCIIKIIDPEPYLREANRRQGLVS